MGSDTFFPLIAKTIVLNRFGQQTAPLRQKPKRSGTIVLLLVADLLERLQEGWIVGSLDDRAVQMRDGFVISLLLD